MKASHYIALHYREKAIADIILWFCTLGASWKLVLFSTTVVDGWTKKVIVQKNWNSPWQLDICTLMIAVQGWCRFPLEMKDFKLNGVLRALWPEQFLSAFRLFWSCRLSIVYVTFEGKVYIQCNPMPTQLTLVCVGLAFCVHGTHVLVV